MIAKEKDQLERLYAHYGHRCFVCGKLAIQRAHIIGNTNLNRKLFGHGVINNPLNWLPVCSLKCNKKVDVGRNEKAERIAIIINSAMFYEEKREAIEAIVREKLDTPKA